MLRLLKQQAYYYNARIKSTWRTNNNSAFDNTQDDKYYTIKYDNTGLFGLWVT